MEDYEFEMYIDDVLENEKEIDYEMKMGMEKMGLGELYMEAVLGVEVKES